LTVHGAYSSSHIYIHTCTTNPHAFPPACLLAGGFPLCCFPPLVRCFPLWLCGGGAPLRFFVARCSLLSWTHRLRLLAAVSQTTGPYRVARAARRAAAPYATVKRYLYCTPSHVHISRHPPRLSPRPSPYDIIYRLCSYVSVNIRRHASTRVFTRAHRPAAQRQSSGASQTPDPTAAEAGSRQAFTFVYILADIWWVAEPQPQQTTSCGCTCLSSDL